MCGIAGYVGTPVPELGERLTELLAHRGPDDSSVTVLDGPFGRSAVLGHRRLSIIDVEGGAQPLANEDGSVQVVFNGAIYNFRELRSELEARGHRFTTRSDTEVLVHLYEEHGADLVGRLRGMFAFAIWDARRGRLVLARDRLGVKPLYWAEPTEGGIDVAFASELKALFEVPGVSRELDLESLASYLAYLYVPHPRTAVCGARKLEPGHVAIAEGGSVEVRRYWALDANAADAEAEPERVWDALEDAVKARMVADVPLGAFLSGGIDSSAIVAAMRAIGERPETFTVVFDREEERLYDEREDARVVAAALGARHHELPVSVDVAAVLPEVVRRFDEPFGNPTALLVYELSRRTREHVKVALAGDGADELFAGYPRFRGLAAASRYSRVPAPVRALAASGVRALPESTHGRHALRRVREFALAPVERLDDAYVDWVTYFGPAERDALLAPAVSERLRESRPPEAFLHDLFDRAPRSDLVNRVSYVELQSFLPCNVLEYGDRMSMAHGLEVRAPFTDHRLVEFVASLPGSVKLRRGRTKWILRRALASRLPERPLAKRKVGFNPPMGIWLNAGLRSLVDSHLAPDVVEARGLLRPDAVASLVRTLRTGRRDVSLHVWSLIVLEQWCREYGAA